MNYRKIFFYLGLSVGVILISLILAVFLFKDKIVRQFIIEANDNSDENVYIKSASLNGQPYTKTFIRHADIMNGGKLTLTMSNQPEKQRGILKEDRPYSISAQK